jgi:proteasome assembly chaperone 3
MMDQIQVPLTGSSSGVVEMNLPSSNKGLLPSTHLTPTTLFGGGGEEDRRILVLGLGLAKTDLEREAFFDLLELAQKVL